MDQSRRVLAALSVLGLIAVLAIAAGLDTLVSFIDRRYAGTFNPFAIIWLRALTALLLAAALLLLFWFVLTRAPRAPWIGVLYLLVGLYIGFAQVLYFAPQVSSWWPPFFNGVVVSRSSYTVSAGSFMAIMGLILLLLPRGSGQGGAS